MDATSLTESAISWLKNPKNIKKYVVQTFQKSKNSKSGGLYCHDRRNDAASMFFYNTSSTIYIYIYIYISIYIYTKIYNKYSIDENNRFL